MTMYLIAVQVDTRVTLYIMPGKTQLIWLVYVEAFVVISDFSRRPLMRFESVYISGDHKVK
jgi:hypothetical protein